MSAKTLMQMFIPLPCRILVRYNVELEAAKKGNVIRYQLCQQLSYDAVGGVNYTVIRNMRGEQNRV